MGSVRWARVVAGELRGARDRRVPVSPISVTYPGVGVADADRVQAAVIAGHLADGARVVGHKVGLTSTAMQQQMGVHEPDSGVLTDRMVHPSGAVLHHGRFLAPRVETELAFRLGRDLHGPEVTTAQARAAVDAVCTAIEVIDTAYGHWRIGLVDSIADNASTAAVIIGPMVALDTVPDPAGHRLRLDVDGAETASGPGSAVLGDPLAALAWLARRHSTLPTTPGGPGVLDGRGGGRTGGGLRAGDLVLAGAVHASVALGAGTDLHAHNDCLPGVTVRVR